MLGRASAQAWGLAWHPRMKPEKTLSVSAYICTSLPVRRGLAHGREQRGRSILYSDVCDLLAMVVLVRIQHAVQDEPLDPIGEHRSQSGPECRAV